MQKVDLIFSYIRGSFNSPDLTKSISFDIFFLLRSNGCVIVNM